MSAPTRKTVANIRGNKLEIHGLGEFLGARQSGQAMLRFADLTTDQ